jgi:hypothetical protein
MDEYQDASIESLRPTGPPERGPAPRPPRAVLLVGGLVLVSVIAIFVLFGGDSDQASDATADAAATTDTVDAFAELTTPLHTAEEFVAALATANPGWRGDATPEETNCAATSTVAALGGPEGLQSFSLTPDEFTDLAILRQLDVPANAADVFLATALACGFDPAEVVVLRHLADSPFGEREACIRARLDRNLANQALARALFDGGGGFAIPAELERHLYQVSDSCLAG